MEEFPTHRNQSLEQTRNWAFCCSLIIHAGVILALGLYLNTPRASLNLPKAIKVDLISMPAAPKVPKKIISQPKVKKPIVVPAVQKPKPDFEANHQPEPERASVPIQKSEKISLRAEVPTIRSERPVVTDSEPLKNLQLPLEETSSEPLDDAEKVSAQVARATTEDNRLKSYSNLIRAQIDKVKRYPLMARKAGKEGTVVIEFSINSQGEMLSSRIINSCGTTALDKAALKALQRASPFAKLPENISSPHRFRLQINFSLAG